MVAVHVLAWLTTAFCGLSVFAGNRPSNSYEQMPMPMVLCYVLTGTKHIII